MGNSKPPFNKGAKSTQYVVADTSSWHKPERQNLTGGNDPYWTAKQRAWHEALVAAKQRRRVAIRGAHGVLYVGRASHISAWRIAVADKAGYRHVITFADFQPTRRNA